MVIKQVIGYYGRVRNILFNVIGAKSEPMSMLLSAVQRKRGTGGLKMREILFRHDNPELGGDK